MRKLAKNTVYVVVIHKGRDEFNWYGKVVNAYRITNAIRKYIDCDDERLEYYSDAGQVTREFLGRKGFIVPTYLSDAQNVVTIEHTVKYKQLK